MQFNKDITQLKDTIDERLTYIVKLKKQKAKALKKEVKGKLSVFEHRKGEYQYYLRDNPSDKHGKYIRKNEIDVARKLAQRDYDKQVLRALDNEETILRKLQTLYMTASPEEVYNKLNYGRQALVNPIRESDSVFQSKWQSKKYPKSELYEENKMYKTNREELVRSKSEKIIADTLDRYGIAYHYEYPVEANGISYHVDFVALNARLRKEFYWEHFGMLDDPDYVEENLRRLANFSDEGIILGDNLLMTAESKLHPLRTEDVERIIKMFLL